MSKITKTATNPHNSLLLLSELMEMDKFTKKVIGFCEIFKVDSNTFTISNINSDDYVNTLDHSGLIDEITFKEVQE